MKTRQDTPGHRADRNDMLAEATLVFAAINSTILPAIPIWPARYLPSQRATSNWTWQASSNLVVEPVKIVSLLTGIGRRPVPRCIRLNNYWCIKRVGWDGEIAADGEGHVAFASASEGARVAVKLLRRYYLDYRRTSALAIVSRWAPAQCHLVTTRGNRKGRRSRANTRGLTTRGIGNTLRARYLARRGGRVARKSTRRLRRSRIASRPVPMLRAPAISPGLGEKPLAIAAIRLPPVTARLKARLRKQRTVPRIPCTREAVRIRNYARKISAAIGAGYKTDLKLFEKDGTPTSNLPPVLAAMARVEIGPWRVRHHLISTAIKMAGAAPRVQDTRAAKPSKR